MKKVKNHGGKREHAGRPKIGRIFFPVRIKREIATEIDRVCFQRSQSENRSVSRGEVVEEKFPLKAARGLRLVVVF